MSDWAQDYRSSRMHSAVRTLETALRLGHDLWGDLSGLSLVEIRCVPLFLGRAATVSRIGLMYVSSWKTPSPHHHPQLPDPPTTGPLPGMITWWMVGALCHVHSYVHPSVCGPLPPHLFFSATFPFWKRFNFSHHNVAHPELFLHTNTSFYFTAFEKGAKFDKTFGVLPSWM